MSAPFIKHYDSPHQFEPLLPSEARMGALLERAAGLFAASSALGSAGPADVHSSMHSELRTLLRKMNSYYTNLMEGEHSRPSDIDRALQKDFSNNGDVARKQRLAIAHIDAEEALEAEVVAESKAMAKVMANPPSKAPGHGLGKQWPGLYETETLCQMHQALFGGLGEEDRKLSDGSTLKPGVIRQSGVAVGRHEAPLFSSLDSFLARWRQVYGAARQGEASIVAIAAAHHRLAWIHPFLDGNGRVCRLHTHLALFSTGITRGLWSPLRGFARSAETYKALLAAADEHRRGDLDGRGNLTEQGLISWIEYAIDTCIDQATFMAQQLDLRGMKARIQACLQFEESAVGRGVRTAALLPLTHLFSTQDTLSRADFKTMTGLGERTATQLVSDLLKQGFLKSDSAYGPLAFSIPPRALRFYFPALWPEAELDEAMLQSEAAAAALANPSLKAGRGPRP